MPEWYASLQAARYLKVAPWDLAEQSIGWTNLALAAIDAESKATQDRAKR
ncbi:MAG: hypothetical protein GX601_06705 [Anaerolineales bacterium]|jgi:hypothetical protein|nr:hypothetical protein [Anaerolineales bacterium]